VVTLWTCIPKIAGSKLGEDTVHPEVSCGFYSDSSHSTFRWIATTFYLLFPGSMQNKYKEKSLSIRPSVRPPVRVIHIRNYLTNLDKVHYWGGLHWKLLGEFNLGKSNVVICYQKRPTLWGNWWATLHKIYSSLMSINFNWKLFSVWLYLTKYNGKNYVVSKFRSYVCHESVDQD
jgi:hypothetical protein